MVKWEKEFAEKGLVIVEISGGKLATYEESQKLVESRKIHHPVLWDKDNRNHKNYEIKSWPAAYLIGADGKVFWQGNPAWAQGRPQELQKLRRLLKRELEASVNRRRESP